MEKIASILKQVFKERNKEVHKYDFGLLLVIGGSKFYSGSPALASLAAFKTGVDMVQVLAPERAANIIASFSPNLASFPLKGDYLNENHLSILLEMTKAAEEVSNGKVGVVIGGGMGRDEKTQEVILNYLSKVEIPVVIDADGIHALAKKKEIAKEKNFLITPHSYEFFILTGKKVDSLSEEERAKLTQEEASKLGSTILLKGAVDVISNGREVALNKAGSPFMTKGGTGDTLAGICGSLLAQGINPFKAAQAGSFINGRAGELAAEKKKQGLLATDLIEEIPKACMT